MSKAYSLLSKLPTADTSSINVTEIATACEDAINDDFSTHLVIATLFDAVKSINSIAAGKATITATDLEALKTVFDNFAGTILGLDLSLESDNSSKALEDVMQVLLNLRDTAKANKDFATSDAIRDQLTAKGITVKDGKDGVTWSYDA
jgi:cysteinyl-tRNA synthetase